VQSEFDQSKTSAKMDQSKLFIKKLRLFGFTRTRDSFLCNQSQGEKIDQSQGRTTDLELHDLTVNEKPIRPANDHGYVDTTSSYAHNVYTIFGLYMSFF
jgi:hypothetical protein